jgi:hypothetical protein
MIAPIANGPNNKPKTEEVKHKEKRRGTDETGLIGELFSSASPISNQYSAVHPASVPMNEFRVHGHYR